MDSIQIENIKEIDYLKSILDRIKTYGIDVSNYYNELDTIIDNYEKHKKSELNIPEEKLHLTVNVDSKYELSINLNFLHNKLNWCTLFLSLMDITENWDLDISIDETLYSIYNNVENILEYIYDVDIQEKVVIKYYDLILKKILKDYKDNKYDYLEEYNDLKKNNYLKNSVMRFLENENIVFNGNIDWGELSPTNSVKNFISDLYNISEGSWVGHRLNVLELEATEVSFGYCKKYTTLSMYYPYNANGGIVNTNNNDKFYAYPSAGYFPKQNFTTHEYWSFVPTEGFAKKDLNINDVSIEIEYDGKIYTQKPTGVEGIAGIENKGERTYPAIVFELPQEVIDDLGGAWQEMPVTDIGIEIKGLKDTAGNNLIYKYTVNFFDINENTDPSNLKLGDVNDDGKINARDAKLVMQHFTKKITLTEEEQKRAEVSGDGKINARDAKLIMQYFTKKIDKFPVEE